MPSRKVRELAIRGTALALERFGPDVLSAVTNRAGKALGLVPSEHREQVKSAAQATANAVRGAREALAQGDCRQAMEAASAARAFALLATVEAKNGGGGHRANDAAAKAVRAAKRAHTATLEACDVVRRKGLPAQKSGSAQLAPVPRALPPAPMNGLRKRRRR